MRSKKHTASSTDMATASPSDRPAMVTARLSGFKRAPPQALQGSTDMNSSSPSRTESLLLAL
jgi:hypothetical protein